MRVNAKSRYYSSSYTVGSAGAMKYIMQASNLNALLRRYYVLYLAPQQTLLVISKLHTTQGPHNSDRKLTEIVWRFGHVLHWHQCKLPFSFHSVLAGYSDGVLARGKILVAADPFSQ